MAVEDTRYSSVSSEDREKASDFDREDAELLRFRNKTSNKRRNIAFFAIPTVVSIATVFALLILANSIKHTVPETSIGARPIGPDGFQGYQPTHVNPTIRHCGASPTEARTRGCIFDTIAFAWLVPECYDAALEGEYLNLKIDFPFYADPQGAKRWDFSEIVKGEKAMYVPWKHHLWHCAYMFRKMHRAIINGAPVDSYVGNYTHTEHCTHLLLVENNQHDENELNTYMKLKFPYCGAGETQFTGGTNYSVTHNV